MTISIELLIRISPPTMVNIDMLLSVCMSIYRVRTIDDDSFTKIFSILFESGTNANALTYRVMYIVLSHTQTNQCPPKWNRSACTLHNITADTQTRPPLSECREESCGKLLIKMLFTDTEKWLNVADYCRGALAICRWQNCYANSQLACDAVAISCKSIVANARNYLCRSSGN